MDEQQNQNWDAILKFLQPEPIPYCPEEPSIPQKAFLRYKGDEAFYGGAAGGGKSSDICHMVPTPTGMVQLKDIHPGHIIFGRDGKPHEVLAESEIMTVQGWKLTFDDGHEINCNDEHLWLTFDAIELSALTRREASWKKRRRENRPSRSTGKKSEAFIKSITERNAKRAAEADNLPLPTGTVRRTDQIVATLTTSSGRRNHAIPVAEPLQFPERDDLLIEPYLLGAWLGDGTSSGGGFTGIDPEIWEEFEKFGFELSHSKKLEKVHYIKNFVGLLRSEGVLNNKHVPEKYLYSSEEQRVRLLQGLFDTDGNIGNNGSVEFSNTNRNIVESAASVVRSLGMKCTVREFRTKLNGKDCGPGWRIKFKSNRQVFKLARKSERLEIASRRTTEFRYIVAAERIEEPIPMKCLKVDSPDELFLIGEGFIPTHNSSALLMAALQYIDVPGYSGILFRRTFADLALPGALMDRFKSWINLYPGEIQWNGSTNTAVFPSGARIGFGYLNNENDHLRYKGAEFQFIGMDEISEIREEHYTYLFSRLRRPKVGPLAQVPLRMRSSSNPAPNWVRQRFIVEGPSMGRIFVPAKLTDNPGIDVDSYRQSLSRLSPVERLRLEQGDWWSTALGSSFQRKHLQDSMIEPAAVPEFSPGAKAVRFWDLAASEPTESYKDPDYTVGTLALYDNGIFYVMDVQRFRHRPDKVEELIAKTAAEDGKMVAIRMEQEPGSAGKSLASQYSRFILPGYDFRAIPSSGDKILRSQPFASAVANGNVRVLVSHWNSNWMDELTSFPEAVAHDDQVDSVASAYTFLTGLGNPKRKVRIIV